MRLKNTLTHLVSGAIVLTVGFAAGNVYHHQQVVLQERAKAAAQVAAEAKARADEAAKEAAAKAQQAQLAAQAATKKPVVRTSK